MLRGTIVKAYSGYYYVQHQDKIIECKLRGRFKKERFSLVVGDVVEYNLLANEKGVIEDILPRQNLLLRPMVANVNQVIIVFAAANPDIDTGLIDKFLVLAELSGLDTKLCINKMDLADAQEIEHIKQLYSNVGYPVYTVAARDSLGIQAIRDALYERVTVFSGPSGVGKSTLLNAIEPGLELVTNEVSAKIGRGRHTTRFAELLRLSGGGFVVDTPGFSLTEFNDVDTSELMYCFPEIAQHAPRCKFSSCLHNKEPQCAVKQAVHDNLIAKERYHSYISILNELSENKKGY